MEFKDTTPMILYTGWTCLKVFLQWIFIVIFYILLIIKKIEEGMARKVEYAEKKLLSLLWHEYGCCRFQACSHWERFGVEEQIQLG